MKILLIWNFCVETCPRYASSNLKGISGGLIFWVQAKFGSKIKWYFLCTLKKLTISVLNHIYAGPPHLGASPRSSDHLWSKGSGERPKIQGTSVDLAQFKDKIWAQKCGLWVCMQCKATECICMNVLSLFWIFLCSDMKALDPSSQDKLRVLLRAKEQECNTLKQQLVSHLLSEIVSKHSFT